MSAEPMSPERLAAAREVVASGMPMANERAADLLAEVDRLRSDRPTRLAIAQATTRRGWHFAPTADIVHVDGCDCEQADAWAMEMDPRCSTGPEHTAVTLDDGSYTQWIIDLDAFAAAVEQTREWDDTAEAVLVTRDGPCIPLAFIDDRCAFHSDDQQPGSRDTQGTLDLAGRQVDEQ